MLENRELLDSLNKTKESSITIAESLAESVHLQASLDQVRRGGGGGGEGRGGEGRGERGGGSDWLRQSTCRCLWIR